MKLSWKARRWLSMLWLILGLPLYIIVAVVVIGQFERLPFLLELLVYVVLGVIWAFPAKYIFRGVGQAEPEEERRPRD